MSLLITANISYRVCTLEHDNRLTYNTNDANIQPPDLSDTFWLSALQRDNIYLAYYQDVTYQPSLTTCIIVCVFPLFPPNINYLPHLCSQYV